MTTQIVRRGIVKWFNARDGYGFIARDGDADLFVHHSSIAMDGYRYLSPGQVVEFELGRGRDGRDEATQVRIVSDAPDDDASTDESEESVQVG